LLGDPGYLRCEKPGLLAALPRGNPKAGAFHVHLHVLVTPVDWTENGDWKQAKKGCPCCHGGSDGKFFRWQVQGVVREEIPEQNTSWLPKDMSINPIYALLFRLSQPWNVKVLKSLRWRPWW